MRAHELRALNIGKGKVIPFVRLSPEVLKFNLHKACQKHKLTLVASTSSLTLNLARVHIQSTNKQYNSVTEETELLLADPASNEYVRRRIAASDRPIIVISLVSNLLELEVPDFDKCFYVAR